MVVTRWESSSRPLFIRTVWRDGHHHVVFEDEEVPVMRTSRRSAVTTAKQTVSDYHNSNIQKNFKVPSVKLLLAGLRNPKIKRCKTEDYSRGFMNTAITIDIIPSDSVRFNDINKQVTFDKFTPTRSGDSVITTPPPFSYSNYCLDQFNNSLSERVMIWLDLAVQNRKIKNFDVNNKKRVVTAQGCPVTVQPKTNQESVVKKRTITPKIVTPPLITSHMECDRVDIEPNVEKKVKSCNSAKRQLHIFLPNLPKKTSESGSVLSSVLSSKESSLLFNKKI